jgi:sodium/hydrogen antiporter
VGLSVFAHGITAAPLAARYASWFERHPDHDGLKLEGAPTDVTRTRGPIVGGAHAFDAHPGA